MSFYFFFKSLDFGGWLVELELRVNALQKKKNLPHKQNISQGWSKWCVQFPVENL